MAFKLNKGQAAILEKHIADLHEARDALAQAMATYAESLSDAREFRDELVSGWREDIEDRSEKWKESEKGEAATTFVDAWEALELDEMDFEPENECSHADALGEAPTEAE